MSNPQDHTPYIVEVRSDETPEEEAWMADRADSAEPPVTRESVRAVVGTVAELDGEIAWYAPVFSYVGIRVPEASESTVLDELGGSRYVERVQPERREDSLEPLSFDPKTVEVEPNSWMLQAAEQVANATEEFDVSSNPRFPIAVLDSGIDERNPGIRNLVGHRNYTTAESGDDLCHGTIVALLLELYRTPYLDFKVGSTGGLAEGSVLCALNDVAVEGLRVVNLSLGFRPFANEDACLTCKATETLANEKDVLITAASGNHGSFFNPTPEPWCPARSEYTISVGATDLDGRIADHSARAELYVPDGIRVRNG